MTRALKTTKELIFFTKVLQKNEDEDGVDGGIAEKVPELDPRLDLEAMSSHDQL